MKIIKNLKALEQLREAGDLPQDYLDLVEKDLVTAIEVYQDEESEKIYDPDDDGYFVVVDEEDGAKELAAVGLTEGSLMAQAESVEPFLLLDEVEWLRVSVLYNNQCLMTFYASKTWLERHQAQQQALGDTPVGNTFHAGREVVSIVQE